MQKYLEDRHGSVTILLSTDGIKERKGFVVDGQAPLYSIACIPPATMEGRTSVNAYRFFEDRLKDIVSAQLEEYQKAHAADMSIYGERGFWDDALRIAGTSSPLRIMVLYYDIQNGLLHFLINGYLSGITYDVVKDKCQCLKKDHEYSNADHYPLLDAYYGPRRRLQLLAEYQRSIGVALQPFAEITAANAFLCGMRANVYAVFKGNAEVKLKADNSRYHIGTLMEYDRGVFHIRQTGYRMNDIVGIRHRHVVFSVNAWAFGNTNRFPLTGTDG